jgi:hypothetical protein
MIRLHTVHVPGQWEALFRELYESARFYEPKLTMSQYASRLLARELAAQRQRDETADAQLLALGG